MIIRFWGVRGTLPVPGKKSLHYGGNTNCVTVNIHDKEWFIFDAGTGIKQFSNYLTKNKISPFNAHLFITHPHWDHISTIPYFAQFYTKGNNFTVYSPGYDNISTESLLFGQMDSVHFPVTITEFQANINFKPLKEESFYIDEISVTSLRLNHPGICLGYRLQYDNKSFCYITDNELYLPDSPKFDQAFIDRLIDFIHGTDVLVIDSTYSDEEYLQKVNWGHSSISQVVALADAAKVKTLCLYHHDPNQLDQDIDKKLQLAKELLANSQSLTRCLAPCEGDFITI